jgi:hypothetical protein
MYEVRWLEVIDEEEDRWFKASPVHRRRFNNLDMARDFALIVEGRVFVL